MSVKYEVIVLNHRFQGGATPDPELAQYLNDGWELFGQIGYTSVLEDGDGCFVDSRIVTLRREIPSHLQRLWDDIDIMCRRIGKQYGHSDQPIIRLVTEYNSEAIESDKFLHLLEEYRADMKPRLLAAFEQAKSSQMVYDASLREDDDL